MMAWPKRPGSKTLGVKRLGLILVFLALVLVVLYVMSKKRPVNLSPKSRHLAIITLYAEAGHEPEVGQISVAHVFKNRIGAYPRWKDIASVVTACGWSKGRRRRYICQFEPWGHAAGRKKMRAFGFAYQAFESGGELKYRAAWQKYRALGSIIDAVMAGELPDPNHGAFFFENRNITKKRGRNALCKTYHQRGRHNFCCRNQRRCKPPETQQAGWQPF